MWVEDVQVQIIIFVGLVAFEPIGGLRANLGAEIVFFALADKVHIAPVALVLAQPVALGAGKIDGIGIQRVGFDTAHEFKARIAHVIIARALLPQVEVIGQQATHSFALFHHPLH